MPWEDRNGTKYYYRKERDGDTVRSVYVGQGALARSAAARDRSRKEAREKRRKALKREKKAQKRMEKAGRKAGRFIRAVRDAALIGSGYHTHKGQWRKSRSYSEEKVRSMIDTETDSPPKPEIYLQGVDIPEDVVELVSRTRGTKADPSQKDRAALRVALRDCPELLERIGDAARHAVDVALKGNFPDPAVQEAVRKKMEALRDEMKRESGQRKVPVVERLLIEQVVICWLQYHATLLKHERARQKARSPERGQYWEERLSAAQRRYLRAMRTLRDVGGKGITVQINPGENEQVANL